MGEPRYTVADLRQTCANLSEWQTVKDAGLRFSVGGDNGQRTVVAERWHHYEGSDGRILWTGRYLYESEVCRGTARECIMFLRGYTRITSIMERAGA